MEFNKKSILTSLSVHDIEYALCNYFDKRKKIIVPNVSWGFFSEHEADLVVVTPAGYLTEIEIKRSWRDFLKDFRKDSFHNDNRITEFYYCVPECMVEAVKEFLDSDRGRGYGTIGIISYSEQGYICFERGGRKRISLKLTTAEVLAIARLGVLRFWDIRQKYDNGEKDKKIAALHREIDFLRAEYEAATGHNINEVL